MASALDAHFCTPDEAMAQIRDGQTVATVAMTLVSASESNLKALERRFLETGHPRDLTLIHSCGQSDRERGIQHLAHEGMVRRIVGAHWGLQPRWMELIASNKVEAYCLPQGQMAQLYREAASGLPGKVSQVGLGTFIDPRVEGGKMNERTRACEDLVEVVELDGREFLFYRALPIDWLLIRGTAADGQGNLTTTDEAMKLEVLPAVLACKRWGGKVVAQVRERVETGTLDPKDVTVPGVFIDSVVVCPDPETDHRMTSSFYFDPSFCGQARVPEEAIEPAPMNERKLIARRGVCELYPGAVVNLGTGIPNDMVDAAKIDGCSFFQIYYKVFLPMMKGALMTQIILWFMGIWNDYLAPTIFVQDEKWYTLQVVIRSFNDQYAVNSNYPLIMAASVIAMLPTLLLFFFFQRYIIESMALSGVKG